MRRLLVILLTSLLAVTPTMDVLCRAFCTPDATTVPCHDLAAPSGDGSLSSAPCERDAAAALAPADATRNLVPPAPLLRAQVSDLALPPALTGAHVRRQSAPLRPAHAFPSTIVLRI